MEKGHSNNHSELFSTTAQQGSRNKGFRLKKKDKTSQTSTFWYLFLRARQPGEKLKNSPSAIFIKKVLNLMRGQG